MLFQSYKQSKPETVTNTNLKRRKLLSHEFDDINTKTRLKTSELHEQCSIGLHFINESKNRYNDVAPLDKTRVKLLGLKNDYINGSYIQIDSLENKYISTQAPLPHTFRDFWKMVWDQKSSVIMMLTNFSENGKTKAHRYWPGKSKKYSYKSDETIDNNPIEMEIILIDRKAIGLFGLRQFLLKHNGEERTVHHIQYSNWGDHSQPTSIKDIEKLIMYMELFKITGEIAGLDGPPIIHCSAGVGRAGTFIVCSLIRQLKLARKEINIPNLIVEVRECRVGMVQTPDQYDFICNFAS